MHVKKTLQGFEIQAEISSFPLPWLLGLIFRLRWKGELIVQENERQAHLGFSEGSLVGLNWKHKPLNLIGRSEKEIITTLVREILPLFSFKTGSLHFYPVLSSEMNLIKPHALPTVFLIRYALARIEEKNLTDHLFKQLFVERPLIQLDENAPLEILGHLAKEQLLPYRQKTRITPENIDQNERQLLLSLWSVGHLSLETKSPIAAQFERIINALQGDLGEEEEAIEFTDPLLAESILSLDNVWQEEEAIEAPKEKGKAFTTTHPQPSRPIQAEVPPKSRPIQTERPANPIITLNEVEKELFETEETIRLLLARMEDWNASDIFIGEGKIPAIRVHGKIFKLPLEATTPEKMETFLKEAIVPAALERFRESGDLDIGYSLDDKRRFRLNIHRQKGRIGLVARAIPSGELRFSDLGLPFVLEDFASLQRGLVLVTGATGSGKSTTLAAIINHINETRAAHIITIEEPIEFLHEDKLSRITQREVGADTESFQSALKHVVRESPDVILIGEMRDQETMSIAISAALTGHLVLASLHTIDATQTLQRIMSYYPEHLKAQVAMDLALSLQGIISQRLIPSKHGGRRALAVEIVRVTPAVATLLKQQRVEELTDLMRNSNDPQLFSFNRSLLELYRRGQISYEVGKTYASNPDEFALSAQGMETGIGTFYGGLMEESNERLDMKLLLRKVLSSKASDLHLTSGRPPILRIDGKLKALPYQPLSESDMRLLLYSILSTRQRSIYQLEKEIDFALSLDSGERFRVNAYFQKGKMAAALRVIPSDIPSAEVLGIPESVLKIANQRHGLLLVVGPTGSGKSTTLACLIDRINRERSCRIITIEDPIEFTHQSIKATVDQREVHADTKDFASALKFILRQDPDVILIGEMRDLETMAAAMTAAETGHLVLATLHTNDAIQTIDRIIDAFPSHQQSQIRSQLATALLGVISQRLLLRRDLQGRIAAFEVMLATPAIRHLIRDDKMHQARSIIETSRSIGMISLDDSIKELYNKELISLDEAMRFISKPQVLEELKL